MLSARAFRAVALAAAGAATGCASRSAPTEWPRSAAASPAAAEAPAAVVTRALTAEPPLPGEPAEGWEGLSPEAASEPAPHGAHHGH